MTRRCIAVMASGFLAIALVTGCEDLPGSKGAQGAVVGGAGGAAAGAAIGGEDNRLLGALIGGLIGAGGGYLIGTSLEKADADPEDKQAAEEAVREAQRDPATPEDVRGSNTADLNNDGFVTMDEVIAMERAWLTDDEMLERLRATGQVFELTEEQEDYLVEQGVSRNVVQEMEQIRHDEKEQILNRKGAPGQNDGDEEDRERRTDVIGEDEEGAEQTPTHVEPENPDN